VNDSGSVDWGVSLYPGDIIYLGKSGVVDAGISWLEGPGMDESLTVDIAEAGHACLAVWKAGPGDVATPGVYRLLIQAVSTGVDEAGPDPGRLALSMQPNPLVGPARVSFRLETPQPVELRIFDIHGELVRRFTLDHAPAGRNEVLWDGRDNAGREISIGAYWLRLRAGADQATTRFLKIR